MCVPCTESYADGEQKQNQEEKYYCRRLLLLSTLVSIQMPALIIFPSLVMIIYIYKHAPKGRQRTELQHPTSGDLTQVKEQ